MARAAVWGYHHRRIHIFIYDEAVRKRLLRSVLLLDIQSERPSRPASPGLDLGFRLEVWLLPCKGDWEFDPAQLEHQTRLRKKIREKD